ncbi:S8 family serine peptidase [Thermocrinis sp.]|uniref:S8 family serine peptidase n=1 Tax=Thermocrinis sp. TaxID=2024383 RepID=UPI002FDE1829
MGFFIVLLLLFLGSSLSQERYVKVLYSDGRVQVVDTRKVPLSSLKARGDVIYVEKPIKLNLLDDVAYSSSVALRGSSNQSISVRTYNGQRLSILHLGANVSFSGSCSGSLENLTCSDGNLSINVSSTTDWRLIVQSFGRNLQRSDFSIPAYYIGTGAANTGKTGRNVIIGVIDTGIDWCHPAFRKPDGSSKILYFYEPSTNTEYTKTQIEQFIRQGRCNEDYDGHGTHVAGIASYIAKDAELIVVRTNLEDTDIILGLEYLKRKKDALNRPMVVNMSLGGHFGPHDGTSFLEKEIARYSGKGFVVVVSAGNEGHRKIHAKLNSISSTTSVGINSSTGDIVDGWYKNGTLRVEFCNSSGGCLSANPGSKASGSVGGCNVEIDNTTSSHPLNGDGRFTVSFNCTGNLTLKLTPVSGTPRADLYLSRNSEFTNFFLEDGLGGYLGTVAVPGTSPHVITVGALTSRWSSTDFRSFTDLGKIAYFSSRGPTRDGRIKPDVVAPGYFVLGPLAGTIQYITKAGTSMAAPVVAGLVALILESNPNLTVDEVRGILTSQALSDDFTGTLPNNVYGYGKAFLASIPSSGGDGGGGGGGGGSGGSDVGGGGGGGGCSMAQGSFSTLPVLVLVAFLWLRRLVRKEWR